MFHSLHRPLAAFGLVLGLLCAIPAFHSVQANPPGHHPHMLPNTGFHPGNVMPNSLGNNPYPICSDVLNSNYYTQFPMAMNPYNSWSFGYTNSFNSFGFNSMSSYRFNLNSALPYGLNSSFGPNLNCNLNAFAVNDINNQAVGPWANFGLNNGNNQAVNFWANNLNNNPFNQAQPNRGANVGPVWNNGLNNLPANGFNNGINNLPVGGLNGVGPQGIKMGFHGGSGL